jgi:hypothetical protein
MSSIRKIVFSNQEIDYGGTVGVIPAGHVGEIVDFGRSSGDPVILWEDGRRTIAPWALIVVGD